MISHSRSGRKDAHYQALVATLGAEPLCRAGLSTDGWAAVPALQQPLTAAVAGQPVTWGATWQQTLALQSSTIS